MTAVQRVIPAIAGSCGDHPIHYRDFLCPATKASHGAAAPEARADDEVRRYPAMQVSPSIRMALKQR
jgi:hypothetical protein